jgi:antitoxin HicB
MRKRNLGSSIDDFLIEEGLSDDVSAVAAKRVIAWQLAEVMQTQELTKTEMARRMGTSRAALERLLDPDNTSVTLQTLQSAARAVGGRLEIRLSLGRRAAPRRQMQKISPQGFCAACRQPGGQSRAGSRRP